MDAVGKVSLEDLVYRLAYYEWRANEKQVEGESLFNLNNLKHLERMLQMKKQLGL